MNNYSNREIDLMFKEIKIMLEEQNKTLNTIDIKVTKTNGVVKKHERFLWLVTGAITILAWLYVNNFINCLGTLCKQS